MVEFWLGTFPTPGRIAETALMAERDGWDGLAFTDSQNLGSNTRLRWTIRPGNDLFIVWNRGWQRLILAPRDLSLVPDNELLAVKIRWTFRK